MTEEQAITDQVQVKFVREDAPDKEFLQIELDSEKNEAVYGEENKSKFLLGSKAYLRIFGEDYTVESSIESTEGSLIEEGRDNTYSVEENIEFANGKEGTLSKLPEGPVSWEWLGKDGGEPTFNNRQITLLSEITSILKCTYIVHFDRWSISCNKERSVLVVAIRDDKIVSLSVSFITEKEEEPAAKRDFLELILDDERNEDKTTFEPGEEAFLLLFNESGEEYEYKTSGGICTRIARNIPVRFKDELVEFKNTKTANLAYPLIPRTMVYSWIGHDPPIPIFNGRTITLPEKVVGVLKCTYSSLVDRFKQWWDEEGQVVITITQIEETTYNTASCDVTYEYPPEEVPEGEKEPVPYELEELDFCTGEVVPGAEVILDGISIGFTDAAGIKALGSLIPGSTHTLKVIKTGYIDSDKDKLNNDSFTIPA